MALFVNFYNYISYRDALDEIKYNTQGVSDTVKFRSAIENAVRFKCTDIKWFSDELADVKFGLFWTVSVSIVGGFFTYE